MHIKVDEDLPAQATQRLRAEGYDASSVVEQKMGGLIGCLTVATPRSIRIRRAH